MPPAAPPARPEVLVIAPYTEPTLKALADAYSCHHLWKAADADALIAEVGPRVRAVASRAVVGAGAALIERLPALEIIALYGVGLDKVDLAAARARGITVTYTPDVLTPEVANLGLALLLAAARGVVAGDRWVRDGTWETAKMPLGRSVSGRRLGIVGLGRIGLAVARRAAAFDMEVAYCEPRPKDVPFRYVADVAELARDSDFLILCCAGTPATRHMIDAPVLEALGPEGVLINISRGSVVDEAALIEALESGRLGGAGLDVYADEPRVPAALKALPNVVLLPHLGSSTVGTVAAMDALLLDNLAAHFAGRPVPTPVPDEAEEAA